jgi:UDP-N-acetylenolpyruvoylglucosamine reductase
MSDLQTDIKKTTRLGQDALAALRTKVRGDLIKPGDPQYETARKVYNAMIDKRPALIIRPVDVADVSSAVHFGSEHGLDIAVRGGGHNGPGFGTVDGGLVIDLSRMRGIRVDADEKTVRVEGGALWGDVDHATYPFNLAVPCGFVSTTGVGGLALGGGIGYLARRYGLTIDNLLSVDMVLADGCFVTASKDQNEDLFWAIRGGGGNYGIITSFLFRGNAINSVYGGPMFWPIDEAEAILPYWQDLILNAPEELNGWFGFATVPPAAPFPEEYQLKKMCIIVWCYTGPQEKAEQVFKPIRDFRKPAIDLAGSIPLPSLQSMFDALFPAGWQWYWKAQFFKQYDEHAIDLHLKHGKMLPTPYSTMHIYPINGAVSRVGRNDTAWGYRNANFAQVIVGVDPDPANNDKMIHWAKEYSNDLQPFSLGGGYVNMIMDEGEQGVKGAYGDNYKRLAQIKAKYDPNNLFHINQNIQPKT